SFTPDTAAEEIDTCSVAAADGEVLIEAYITAAGVPGVTLIPSGAWEFHTWRKVDNAVGDSRLVFRVYKYETDTTETELFSVVGEEIDDTTVNGLSVETLSIQPDHVLASTDRIVIKVYGKTTSVAARTISYYHSGTTHYSHVDTPLSAPSASGGDVATDAIWDAAGDLAVGTGADTASALSVGSEDDVLTVVSGVPAWAAPAAGGDITTDAAWAAKGDLIVGTANDTAGILTAGTNDYVLTAASGETTGLKWAASAAGFADPMTTQGDIIVRAAGGTDRLTLGTTGQVLTSDGTDVGWAAAAGGGSLVLLEHLTAATSATLDFTSTISATYDEYVFEIVNLLSATNTVQLYMRVSTDGGTSYDTTTIYSTTRIYHYTTNHGAESQPGVGYFGIGGAAVDNSHVGANGTVKLFSPGSANYKMILLDYVRWVASGINVPVHDIGTGQYASTTAVNAVRFLFSSGNMASGFIRSYGIAKS
ncbi:MAG TPA: hypothetical protein VMW94_04035, partial [Actinomycetes bacterium]|nr:hypothetical protein [Actinomycetes bacterium]